MLIRASEAAREVRPYTNWELHYMLGSDVFSKLDKSDRLTSKFLFMKFTHTYISLPLQVVLAAFHALGFQLITRTRDSSQCPTE